MQLSQEEANRWLVIAGVVLVAGSTLGMGVCLGLWFLDLISDRAMLGVTLALSWFAIVLNGGTFWLQAVTKGHVDA